LALTYVNAGRVSTMPAALQAGRQARVGGPGKRCDQAQQSFEVKFSA